MYHVGEMFDEDDLHKIQLFQCQSSLIQRLSTKNGGKRRIGARRNFFVAFQREKSKSALGESPERKEWRKHSDLLNFPVATAKFRILEIYHVAIASELCSVDNRELKKQEKWASKRMAVKARYSLAFNTCIYLWRTLLRISGQYVSIYFYVVFLIIGNLKIRSERSKYFYL